MWILSMCMCVRMRVRMLLWAMCCVLCCASCAQNRAMWVPGARGPLIDQGMRSVRGVPTVDARIKKGDAPWSNRYHVVVLKDKTGRSYHVHEHDDGAHEEHKHDSMQKSVFVATAWFFFALYKRTWSRFDGNTCRFSPSCSRFGLDAVSIHGPLGFAYTFARLMRNHNDAGFYPGTVAGYLMDPLHHYTFFFDEPLWDALNAYEDRAQGWYMHVKMTRRLYGKQAMSETERGLDK